MRVYYIFILALAFSACTRPDYLLQVHAGTKPTDHFTVFNILGRGEAKPITDSASLASYLTKEELEDYYSGKKKEYSFYATAHKNNTYSAEVLIVTDKTLPGRNYTFLLRTYDARHYLLDSYEFAAWSEGKNIYCSATLDKNLVIEKACKTDKETRRITGEGKIKQQK